MPQITLDDIRSAADKKYGDFIAVVEGEELRFRNPLRLPRKVRSEFKKLFDPANTERPEDYQLWDVYRDMFKLVAENAPTFKKLEAAVKDDAAVWEGLFEAYNEDSQVGEA